MNGHKKIVIVGAGFGGVHAALQLANKPGFTVKLIDPDTYFEYHAALYRSATGRSPLEVAIPLNNFFEFADNVEVVQDTAISVDEKQQALTGQSGAVYHYEELILALGNVTDFYNIPGLEQYAYKVKGIQPALVLKRHLHEQLMSGEVEHNYAVVGGGATGVELAAELVSYLKHIRKAHGVDGVFNVVLIEASGQVLGNLPKKFARKVESRLRQVGVKVALNTPVESETSEYIKISGKKIASHTVIWTAGVKNNPFFSQDDIFNLGKLNRVEVNEHLEAAPHIYVIGDSANTTYSGMAQTALYDSKFVIDNILRMNQNIPPEPYSPKRPTYAIPVGSRWAAVLWGKTEIYGRLGWILRRMADLRLYINFLPFKKALTTWRYGSKFMETCPVCKQ